MDQYPNVTATADVPEPPVTANELVSNVTGPSNNHVDALTPYELWIQLILVYGLAGGLLPATLDGTICIGIARNTKLRTRFFVIVGCISFARLGGGLGFLSMSVFRSIRTLGYVDVNQKRILCHCIHIFVLNSGTAEISLLLTLVIDRFIAIFGFSYYRQLTEKSAFQICVLQYVFATLIKVIPSVIGIDLLETVPCLNWSSSLEGTYILFSSYVNFILITVVLMLYIILIVCIRLKVNRLQRNGSKNGENPRNNIILQRQLRLIPTLRNLVLIQCSLKLTSKLFLWIATLIPRHQQRLVAAGGSLSAIDTLVNCLAVLANPEIRHASLPCSKKDQQASERDSRVSVRVLKEEIRKTISTNGGNGDTGSSKRIE